MTIAQGINMKQNPITRRAFALSFIAITAILATPGLVFGAEKTMPNPDFTQGDKIPENAKPVWGTSPITEPYPYVSTGSFTGPAEPLSPDPLVAYRWPSPKATDGLEIYLQKPIAVSSDTEASFDNLGSLTTDHPNVTVNGTGSIRMDFGRESAAWLEFDSPDCPGGVEMSISEYNQPGPEKTKAPVKHGNTYRLELNDELYEGVRFAWIHVKAPAKPWRITGIRAVCQVKPTNYDGGFSCSDPLLTKIWYMSAYGVKASLCKDYFGAILMDRGDRMSWTDATERVPPKANWNKNGVGL
jgi:hypothetical protein